MNLTERILDSVRRIPSGRVATYGQIAVLAGSPRAARAVGWTLHRLPESQLRAIPWQRVINRRGEISTTCREHDASMQAVLLKKEGVSVQYRNGIYCVDLNKYLWKV